jgi:hypothetical protein
MSEFESGEQLLLPIQIRERREVYLLRAIQTERITRILRKRIVSTEYLKDKYHGGPTIFHINVDEIEKLKDPNLRYALRFVDAAEAADAQMVWVTATDEGLDSRLINASYGVNATRNEKDAFMADLYSSKPMQEVAGMSSVHVHGEGGDPGVVWWVRKRTDTDL